MQEKTLGKCPFCPKYTSMNLIKKRQKVSTTQYEQFPLPGTTKIISKRCMYYYSSSSI